MWRATLAAAAVALSASAAPAQVNPAQLKWAPAPNAFPKGAEMAVLSGDLAKPGIFVVRFRLPAGYRIPAHHHPADEYVTVLSGDLGLGMGDKLIVARGRRMGPGGFAMAPKGMNHFAWTMGGSVIQVASQGPFAITYVDPADDPRKRR